MAAGTPRIPTRVIHFANAVLGAVATLAGMIFLYAVYLRKTTMAYYVLSVVVAALSLASLRIRQHLKVPLALMILATLITLYAVELMLSFSVELSRRASIRRASAATRTVADLRTKLEVIRALRFNGVDAYPTPISPWSPQTRGSRELRSGINIRGVETVPLGGIASKTTVFCNESGQYLMYQSDEHGFNNPKGTWSLPRVDVVALGDSFVHGQCVPSDRDFMSRIRQIYPASLNLGMAGTGPLMELAILQEYLPPVRPSVVLWAFYEGNDLSDLRIEQASPVLMRYLDGRFHQGLRDKQVEIDRALSAVVEQAMIGEKGGTRSIATFATLHALRWRVYALLGIWPGNSQDAEVDLFAKILHTASTSVAAWGGKLYFIYLPAPGRYWSHQWFRIWDPHERIRLRILRVVQELKIPVVDVHEAFVRRGDPKAMFLHADSHYSPMGYLVAAGAALDALRILQ